MSTSVSNDAGIDFNIVGQSAASAGEIFFLEKQMSNEVILLPNVGKSGLKVLASAALAPKAQSHLQDLLARNADGQLSAQESIELDTLIEQIDELNLLKARAEYTLRHQGNEVQQ